MSRIQLKIISDKKKQGKPQLAKEKIINRLRYCDNKRLELSG